MATKNEQTLQIKKFRGVDRFTEGTAQDPDMFKIIQNYKIPNPGELAAINGVTKVKNSIPGVSSILHSKFLDNSNDDYLCNVILSDTSTIQAVPVYAYTTGGGASAGYDIAIEHIGTGGRTVENTYVYTLDATGVTITIPTIDQTVRSINFYMALAGTLSLDQLPWVGAVYRKTDGTWPATVHFDIPSAAIISGDGLVLVSPNYSNISTSNVSGTLASDKIYYLGIGPSYGGSILGVVDFYDSSKVMSIYLPSGATSIGFLMGYLPYDGAKFTTNVLTSVAVDTYAVFIGITPEDMMPVHVRSNNGVRADQPGVSSLVNASNTNLVTKTQKVSTFAAGQIVYATDTITIPLVSKQIPVGTLLKCITHTTGTNVTNGTYYYVKTSALVPGGNDITISLTAGGAAVDLTDLTSVTFGWADVFGIITHLPHSLKKVAICSSMDSSNRVHPTATAGRQDGGWWPTYYGTHPVTAAGLSAICYTENSLNDSLRRDCFIPDFSPSVNLGNNGWQDFNVGASSAFQNMSIPFTDKNDTSRYEWQSRTYGNRLWITNGYNEPMYCNGHVLKPGVPSPNISADTPARWPITKYIEFYKNRLCLANGGSNASGANSSGVSGTVGYGNPTYQEGLVYLSDSGGDINYFNYVAGVPKYISVNTGDQSKIKGLNVYSQDLTSVGAETFLVIGKENTVFVWNGDLVTAPKQISKATGFAGPNCYALTKFGPIFVGNDNVYLFKTSQDITPICNNFKDVIKGMSDAQLYKTNAVYHDEDIKIGYTDTTDIDREVWCRFIPVDGGINTHWSGPHKMASFVGQTTIPVWGTEKNYRLSFNGPSLSRRDDPGSFSNEGSPIDRMLQITNLGLQADQVWKLITRLHLHMRLTDTENFDMTLEGEDGSQSIVVNFSATNSGNVRALKQVIVPQRFLARILTLTLENSNNSDMSIYDFSILFQPSRRRQLS